MDARMQRVQQDFHSRYGGGGERLFRGPGRVNLLGEHTDYNEGLVLPIAIDRDVSIAARPRLDRMVRLYSLDFEEEAVFSLDNIQKSVNRSWSDYVRGIALCLLGQGQPLRGIDAVLQGNVPIGSGLSSSAALEVGFAMVFQQLFGFKMSSVEMALLAQKAEHEFIGVMCGIMDQYISRMGKKGHALLIDCRSLESQAIPIGSVASNDSAPVFVVGDTRVHRELAGSAYNERRGQCEEAVRLLQPVMPGITALRDLSSAQLSTHAHLLSPTTLKRARHVVSEDERVMKGVHALENGNLDQFGLLMNESHDSLRNDYEVSCAELDTIVDAARSITGVLGSRMTGAGFGGCTVSLVEASAVPNFKKVVTARYQDAFGIEPSLYVCTAEDGAHEVIT